MKILNHYLMKYKYKCLQWFIITVLTSIFLAYASLLNMSLIDNMIDKNLKKSIGILIMSLVLWGLYFLCNYIKTNQKNKIIIQINNDIKENMIENIKNKNYVSFHENDIGVYVSWLTNDINQIEQYGLQSLFSFYNCIIVAIAHFIALMQVHILIAIVSMALFIVIYLIPKVFQKKLNQASQQFSTEQGVYTKKIKNILNGFDVWMDFKALEVMKKKSNKSSQVLENTRYYNYKTQSIILNFINFCNILIQSITNLICIYFSVIGIVSPGALLSVGTLSARLYNSLSELSQYCIKISSCQNILKKFEYIPAEKEHKRRIDFTDCIEIKNVSFAYPNSKTILKNINIVFKKGKKYALIGESGCGKSTLLKILYGKLQDYMGNVLIDGNELRDLDMTDYMVYLDQNSYLFDTTLLENMTLGKNYLLNDIVNAMHVSCLDDFVYSVDELNQEVKENGNNFSGGQKQRIALCRAILFNKQIYLVDEITSGLDRNNKVKIEKYLLNNKDITLIYISHHIDKEIENLFDEIVYL